MIDHSLKLPSQKVFPVIQLIFLLGHYGDLSLFSDDGSARLDFGTARHDQTLLSTYAHLQYMDIHQQGWSYLKIENEKVPIHIH